MIERRLQVPDARARQRVAAREAQRLGRVVLPSHRILVERLARLFPAGHEQVQCVIDGRCTWAGCLHEGACRLVALVALVAQDEVAP